MPIAHNQWIVAGLFDAALRMIARENHEFAILGEARALPPRGGLPRNHFGTIHPDFGDRVQDAARYERIDIEMMVTFGSRRKANPAYSTFVSGIPVIAANSSRSAIKSAYDIAR